jgi:hypothetical protein
MLATGLFWFGFLDLKSFGWRMNMTSKIVHGIGVWELTTDEASAISIWI